MTKKLAIFFALTTLLLAFLLWKEHQSKQSLRITFESLKITHDALISNTARIDHQLRNTDSLLRLQITASTERMLKIETERHRLSADMDSLIQSVNRTDSLRKVMIEEYLAGQRKP